MCDCIAKTNDLLRPHNAELSLNLIDPTYVVVATEKIDVKKRGRIPVMIASYYPFCGERYPGLQPACPLEEVPAA